MQISFRPVIGVCILSALSPSLGCARKEIVLKQDYQALSVGKVRFIHKDNELATLDISESMSLRGPGELRAADVRIQVLAPAGWTDCKAIREDRGQEFHQFRFIPPAIVRLYFDIDSNQAIDVQCGELQFQIPAGKVRKCVMPAPVNEIAVSVNGQQMGTILPGIEKANYVVDPTGSHAYQFRSINYRTANNPIGEQPKPLSFEKAKLHIVPRDIDYFLEPAPKTIEVRMEDLSSYRSELLRTN